MSKPIIIGITGRARAGKDTGADYLVNNYGFVKISFAAPIKRALKAMTGIDDDFIYGDRKEEHLDVLCGNSPRRLLQTLGTEWGRDVVGKDFWIKLAMAEAKRQMAAGNNVVISDVRFNNEATAIFGLGGAIWEVIRESADDVEAHSSEKGVWAVPKATLDNNGHITNFYDQIDAKMKALGVDLRRTVLTVEQVSGDSLDELVKYASGKLESISAQMNLSHQKGCRHPMIPVAKAPDEPSGDLKEATARLADRIKELDMKDEAVVKAIEEAGEPDLSEKSTVCGCAKAVPLNVTLKRSGDKLEWETADTINEIIYTCSSACNARLLEGVSKYWPEDMGLSRPCYKDNEPATPRLVFERGETIRLKNESLDAAGTLTLLRTLHSLKSDVEEQARKGFSTAPLRALRYTRAVEVLSSVGESMITARKMCELFLYVVTGKFPDYGISAN
jgi:hypothetical protein